METPLGVAQWQVLLRPEMVYSWTENTVQPLELVYGSDLAHPACPVPDARFNCLLAPAHMPHTHFAYVHQEVTTVTRRL